jgi:hypothetical protein
MNADKSIDEIKNENKNTNRTENQNRELLFAQGYEWVYAGGAAGWNVTGQ